MNKTKHDLERKRLARKFKYEALKKKIRIKKPNWDASKFMNDIRNY